MPFIQIFLTYNLLTYGVAGIFFFSFFFFDSMYLLEVKEVKKDITFNFCSFIYRL